MVLPNHIREAERIGMPEDKPEFLRCQQCDKLRTDEKVDNCDECGRECCPKCWYYISDIGLKFCGKDCAITRILKLLAAAEMNDKPITEHPDVQRLVIQVETLGQENKKLKEAIEKVSPGISRAMGNYEEARYIEISVLYDALKGNER